MGFLESVGVKGNLLGDINFSGAKTGFLVLFLVFLFVVVVALITFAYYSRKIKKISYRHQIPIYQRVHGKLTRIGIDWAKEVFIPNTNISLFFLRDRKLYLARPTRPMGKDEYWYVISQNGEWINFDLESDPKKDTLAKANYDHRDNRYAFTNLAEIIKRNFKDKSVKWWKDPVIMNMITFIIMSIIFLGFIWFVISKVGTLLDKIAPMMERADKMLQAAQQNNCASLNSGVSAA